MAPKKTKRKNTKKKTKLLNKKNLVRGAAALAVTAGAATVAYKYHKRKQTKKDESFVGTITNWFNYLLGRKQTSIPVPPQQPQPVQSNLSLKDQIASNKLKETPEKVVPEKSNLPLADQIMNFDKSKLKKTVPKQELPSLKDQIASIKLKQTPEKVVQEKSNSPLANQIMNFDQSKLKKNVPKQELQQSKDSKQMEANLIDRTILNNDYNKSIKRLYNLKKSISELEDMTERVFIVSGKNLGNNKTKFININKTLRALYYVVSDIIIKYEKKIPTSELVDKLIRHIVKLGAKFDDIQDDYTNLTNEYKNQQSKSKSKYIKPTEDNMVADILKLQKKAQK